jgi:hypothetical protein
MSSGVVEKFDKVERKIIKPEETSSESIQAKPKTKVKVISTR